MAVGCFSGKERECRDVKSHFSSRRLSRFGESIIALAQVTVCDLMFCHASTLRTSPIVVYRNLAFRKMEDVCVNRSMGFSHHLGKDAKLISNNS